MGHASKKRDVRKRDVRDVPFADEHQEYARVLRLQGNGRVSARFVDGSERTCRIRGSMRRKEWVHAGDLVLASRRDGLSTDTCDIVYRYQAEEVAYLRRVGEKTDHEDARDDVDVVVFEADDDAACWEDV